MTTTYRVLAYVIAAVVAVQAASVAMAFFTVIHQMDGGVGSDLEGNVGVLIHRVGGLGIIPLAAIALLVVSFFTGTPGAVRWSAVVLGLVVLQIVFVFAAFAAAWAGALHGANAIALFLAATWAAHRTARTTPREERAPDRAAA